MKHAVQIQHDENLEYALKSAAAAGFHYVSVGFGSSKCFHHADWEKEILRVSKLLSKYQLECVQTHFPYYDLRISAEIIDEEMDRAMLRCLKATAELGAFWVAYHPRSAVSDNFSPRRSMEYAIAALEPMVEEAQRVHAGIALENLPIFPGLGKMRFFSSDYEDLCVLHDHFSSPNVGICWDFGHANLMGNDQKKALQTVGKRLKITHVHNNDGTDDQHYLPTQGTISWEEQIPVLKACADNEALTLEINYTSNSTLQSFFAHALSCLEWMETLSETDFPQV